jgi:HAD superfamily hydrolase (TIGR01509 family)
MKADGKTLPRLDRQTSRVYRFPQAEGGPRPAAEQTASRTIALIVVFDIGNVLISWNPRFLFRKTFADEARMERFLATALAMDWIAHTDIVADFSSAVEARARAFPEFADELRMFDTRWIESIGGPMNENVALLRRLKAAGRPVHALSNFAHEKFALVRERYDFLSEFDTAVISGHVGVVKPHPRIYEILFKRVGRSPSDLLFVDDSPANISAARSLGMAAIRYRQGLDLESELIARGALS